MLQKWVCAWTRNTELPKQHLHFIRFVLIGLKKLKRHGRRKFALQTVGVDVQFLSPKPAFLCEKHWLLSHT